MAVTICIIGLAWVLLSVLLAFCLGRGLRRAEVLGPSRPRNEGRAVSKLQTPDRLAAAG
jgi:hypothetical protein